MGDFRCQFGHGHIGTLGAMACEHAFLQQGCKHKWMKWVEKEIIDGEHSADSHNKKYRIYVQCRNCDICGLNEYSEHRVFLGERE